MCDKVFDHRAPIDGQPRGFDYTPAFPWLLPALCVSTRHFIMSDEVLRTVALYDIADDLGEQVSNVCATLFERQR